MMGMPQFTCIHACAMQLGAGQANRSSIGAPLPWQDNVQIIKL
jgi:hypothetical protein